MYDSIIVDTFNYYITQAESQAKETVRKIITNIEQVLLTKLNPEGKIYFLFDPLPTKNHNITAYKRSSERLKVSMFYKLHREIEKEHLKGIFYLKEYLQERDPRFVSVYDGVSEADDFVEPILSKLENQKVALVSRDSDWCRYINKNTYVTDYTLKRELTQGDFESKKGFKPTIASVTFEKVFFGDPADNIEYVFAATKGIRNKYKLNTLYPLATSFIKELGETNESLDSVVDRISKYTNKKLYNIHKPNAEEKLFKELINSEIGIKNNFLRDILTNVSLIRCRFQNNLDKFMYTCTQANPNYCELIDATLGINKFQKSFASKFCS